MARTNVSPADYSGAHLGGQTARLNKYPVPTLPLKSTSEPGNHKDSPQVQTQHVAASTRSSTVSSRSFGVPLVNLAAFQGYHGNIEFTANGLPFVRSTYSSLSNWNRYP
uniref:Uncharacterized protein n=1 Tax=Psilocybe cubensis TaxID=181762 RepID=A0A8H7Y016_PSICU